MAALALAVALAGCGGSGVVITDGMTCGDWLDGNGRDAYLQVHGLKEYDSGDTGRYPRTAAIARAMTDTCVRDRGLLIDEALRRAATSIAGR